MQREQALAPRYTGAGSGLSGGSLLVSIYKKAGAIEEVPEGVTGTLVIVEGFATPSTSPAYREIAKRWLESNLSGSRYVLVTSDSCTSTLRGFLGGGGRGVAAAGAAAGLGGGRTGAVVRPAVMGRGSHHFRLA